MIGTGQKTNIRNEAQSGNQLFDSSDFDMSSYVTESARKCARNFPLLSNQVKVEMCLPEFNIMLLSALLIKVCFQLVMKHK